MKKNNSYIKNAHSNAQVDPFRLVDKNPFSSIVKVQVRFVAKDRRDICDQPE